MKSRSKGKRIHVSAPQNAFLVLLRQRINKNMLMYSPPSWRTPNDLSGTEWLYSYAFGAERQGACDCREKSRVPWEKPRRLSTHTGATAPAPRAPHVVWRQLRLLGLWLWRCFFNELHANLLSFSQIMCKILMSSSLFDTFRACQVPNKMPRAYKIINVIYLLLIKPLRIYSNNYKQRARVTHWFSQLYLYRWYTSHSIDL